MLCAVLSLAGLIPAGGAVAAPASATAAAASQPEAAIQEFVSAFNALDRTRFDALFADDVTLFFPSSPFPLKRVEGKAATLEWFGRLFDSMTRRGTSPGVKPQDLFVQDYGDVAIATFHLIGGESVGRRTIVIRRHHDQWVIAHLHASSEKEPRAEQGN
jgi:ketosteroid isomerase-like protein